MIDKRRLTLFAPPALSILLNSIWPFVGVVVPNRFCSRCCGCPGTVNFLIRIVKRAVHIQLQDEQAHEYIFSGCDVGLFKLGSDHVVDSACSSESRSSCLSGRIEFRPARRILGL